MGLFSDSDSEEDRTSLLMSLRKLVVPLLLVIDLVMNWGQPIIIAVKVTLTLLTTKPSPLSVYVLVEQVRSKFFVCTRAVQNNWGHHHFVVELVKMFPVISLLYLFHKYCEWSSYFGVCVCSNVSFKSRIFAVIYSHLVKNISVAR